MFGNWMRRQVSNRKLGIWKRSCGGLHECKTCLSTQRKAGKCNQCYSDTIKQPCESVLTYKLQDGMTNFNEASVTAHSTTCLHGEKTTLIAWSETIPYDVDGNAVYRVQIDGIETIRLPKDGRCWGRPYSIKNIHMQPRVIYMRLCRE